VGRNFSFLYGHEERKRGRPEAVLREAAASGLASETGWRARNDGAQVWVELGGRPGGDDDGTGRGGAALLRDLPASRLAEAELRESEERFRTMADSAPVLLWMSGLDGLCNFFNEGWLRFTGRTLDQELGNGWAESVHAEDFQRCMHLYLTSFVARQSFA